MADTGKALYQQHSQALTVMFGDIENVARSQELASIGTPGTLLTRQNATGFPFYAHQFYGPGGKKREAYVSGPVGDPEAERAAQAVRDRIASVKGIQEQIRVLVKTGFTQVDAKTYAAVATLANKGVFRAGAVLVGSHAYGALLNHLGVRGLPYATQDIDIATTELAFAEAPSQSFGEMLNDSGVRFVEVPGFNRTPGSSFKEPGKSFLQVDLLVPSANEDIVEAVPVPELRAHATALPYLRYLLGEAREVTILSKDGCCLVRTPAPERYALHKLLVSQLRRNRPEKSRKDLTQACPLIAALAELHPGALEEAAAALPTSSIGYLRASLAQAASILSPHPRAVETLNAILAEP